MALKGSGIQPPARLLSPFLLISSSPQTHRKLPSENVTEPRELMELELRK